MEDYRLTQSGQEVQDILNGAAMQVDLTAETERATEAEQTLQDNIDAEETRAQGAEDTLQDNIDAEETRAEGAELTLQGNIDAEETRAKAAEKQNADDIDAIEEKIPSGASSSNKLATEEYVNDSVATATATFRGTYNVVTDLSLLPSATHSQISASLQTEIATADSNDYAFVLIPTSVETPEEIEKIERYKYNGSVWGFEYVLNNSGFTAAQWASINSGITSNAVGKLDALPNNAELTTLLNGKQDTLTFDNVPTQGSSNPVKSGGVYSAIKSEETRAMAAENQNANGINALNALVPAGATSENKLATIGDVDEVSSSIEAILLLIPSAASALNQLADKAFVNSSIATATATFRGTYNLVTDLSLNVNATHSQIAGALGINISTADNNDYAFVQIPTSLETPTEIRLTERYKFNGTAWAFEYDLNNSGFTSAQWAAINSGITIALVGKLNGLPTNAELTTLLNGKQNTLTFDNVPTLGSDNPVKSSGIYNVIKAITDLIPAEATAQNQLADKADVAAKIVAAIPSWKGQYDALTDLQAVTGAKAGDMGCVKTTDSDGHAVLTFYQYSAQGAWVVYYTLRHYAQNKPATTGTTGDYPYNGMGRIELQKNIVNGVNTLTQAMFTQQNTIYVIQYDFTLGEDITVPENCVLEFDGGSISASGTNDTITGTNTGINAGLVKILGTDVTLAGSWNVAEVYPEWWGAIGSNNYEDSKIQKAIDFAVLIHSRLLFSNKKTYKIDHPLIIGGDGDFIIDGNGCVFYKDTSTTTGLGNVETAGGEVDFERNVIIAIPNRVDRLILRNIYLSSTSEINAEGMIVAFMVNSIIENMEGSQLGNGIAIYESYVSKISKCRMNIISGTAFAFDGSRLNDNVFLAGTSLTVDNCYANNAGIGYYIRALQYSTFNSCAADNCTFVSYIWQSSLTFNCCGAEFTTDRLIVIAGNSNIVFNSLWTKDTIDNQNYDYIQIAGESSVVFNSCKCDCDRYFLLNVQNQAKVTLTNCVFTNKETSSGRGKVRIAADASLYEISGKEHIYRTGNGSAAHDFLYSDTAIGGYARYNTLIKPNVYFIGNMNGGEVSTYAIPIDVIKQINPAFGGDSYVTEPVRIDVFNGWRWTVNNYVHMPNGGTPYLINAQASSSMDLAITGVAHTDDNLVLTFSQAIAYFKIRISI